MEFPYLMLIFALEMKNEYYKFSKWHRIFTKNNYNNLDLFMSEQ